MIFTPAVSHGTRTVGRLRKRWIWLGVLATMAVAIHALLPAAALASTGPRPEAIVNHRSLLCLDVVSASTASGANVQQFRCHYGPNQQWDIVPNVTPNFEPDGTYLLINRNSGKCLDVVNASTANGANVQQFTCHRGANQRWLIRSDQGRGAHANSYRFVNVASGKCLDVVDASTANHANVQQFSCHGGDNQRWARVPISS